MDRNLTARRLGPTAALLMAVLGVCLTSRGAGAADAVTPSTTTSPTVNALPVTMAVVGPMLGTSFSVGLQFKVGAEVALDALPDQKLLGREVRLVATDDQCVAAVAEKVALDLVQTPPQVVIGHSCSGATLAAAPTYAQSGVLQITPASTNPRVTEMGITTIFRMIGRDDTQGELAAERLAVRHAGKRIGVVRFPSAYSTALTDVATKSLAARGITPVTIVDATAGQASYLDQLRALIDAKVETLYIAGGALDTAVLVRQARMIDAPFAIVSADTLVSKVFQETAGEAGDGIPFTFPPEAAKLATAQAAVRAIQAKGLEPVGYTLLAHAAVETWIEGVRRANDFDAGKVAAAIRAQPVRTILGEITFDQKGDIHTAHPPFAWYVWKRGERVAAD